MDVIFDTADEEGGRIEVLADPRKVGVGACAEVEIRQERLSMFRGEAHMYIDLDEGLGHG